MSVRDGRATRWAGQRERRRAEFVDAAVAAIATHGPEVTSEQIAAQAGVARTRLYRHFDGNADLHGAITQRAVALITADLEPVWDPHGTPREMITVAVRAFVTWADEHRHLYQYLTRAGADVSVKNAVGVHLTGMFGSYLRALRLDDREAEPLAFGLVGMVVSATDRWLADATLSLAELTGRIATWVWGVLDSSLRSSDIEIDPDRPLLLVSPSGLGPPSWG